MSFIKLLFRSLKYYRFSHLGTLLGTALAASVISAALLIGSSVQSSLENIVTSRLGNTDFVIVSNNRFFKADLSERIAKKLNCKTTALHQYKGIALTNNEKKVNNLQVFGIDNSFWSIVGNNNLQPNLKDDEVIINQKLASELQLNVNDEFVLRIQKIGFVPVNTPFVPDDANSISKRVVIKNIATENDFGNFNLRTNQIVPFNVFMSRKYLSEILLKGSFANIILIDSDAVLSDKIISESLKKSLTLEDINYKISKLDGKDQFELNSKRVFIDEPLKKQILKNEKSAFPVFTYFVNAIKKGDKETPYTFVCAPGVVETEALQENEIILNEWIANDLSVKTGDTIEMFFYATGYLKELIEKSQKFIIRKIMPMNTVWADSSLIPGIDGLSDVEKCGDWKAGIPVNLKKIRAEDETYWKHFKGTPKAYVSYKTAVKLWSTEYGNCTAVRFKNTVDTAMLKKEIVAGLNPEQFGLNVISVKDEGKWSAKNAVDFSGLFIGLSFFLLLAAILLISLLFSMHIDLRVKEQGIYLALGLREKFIRKIFFAEGFLIAILGTLLGIIPGLFLCKLVFFFLNTIWSDVIRTNSIEVNFDFFSIGVGSTISIVIAMCTILIILWRKSLLTVNNLQRKNIRIFQKNKNFRSAISVIGSLISLIAAFVIFALLIKNNDFQNQGLFFFSGVLLLTGCMLFINFMLLKFNDIKSLSISGNILICRNFAARKKSFLSLVSIPAIATFLVISVGLNRTDFTSDLTKRNSGTGGFLLYCETTLPILKNLNSPEAKKKYNIKQLPDAVNFIQLKKLTGDDASCLNLNRAVRPNIIAVNPEELSERNSFLIVESMSKKSNSWTILNDKPEEDFIPAIADLTVIKWGLGKNIGDTLTYINEAGNKIILKLVAGLENSIFQGNIIISESNFKKHFPSIAGSNIILVDAPVTDLKICTDKLMESFQEFGISVVQTSERLLMFNSVTNTYLDIFLSLGGIALIVGIIGIAVVIVKNISEQKHEFAMMQAVGLSRNMLKNLVLKEYIIVVFTGLFVGLFAAFLSVFPSLRNSNQVTFVVVLISIFIVNSVIWIAIAAAKSLKKDFLYDLRNE